MAPRRRADRRRPAGSTEPSQPDPPAQPNQPKTALSYPRILFLVLLFLGSLAVYFLTGSSPVPPPSDISIYDRGLVKAEVSYQEILAENERISSNRSYRHFSNPVLAYVTPWNSKGYEMAKLFSSKFTHISPVWYELKSEWSNLVLAGQHNVDFGWISELRKRGDSLVVPRVVLEANPAELLVNQKQLNKAIDLIIKECREMGFDGIVLESWSTWAGYGALNDPDLRNKGLQFIKQLGDSLHSVNSKSNPGQQLQLIFVIPPVRTKELSNYDFAPGDLRQLADSVDGFSLMTYDFSGPQTPGPNAPLEWMKYCLNMLLSENIENKHMIFLGINFYGNDFELSDGKGGGAIMGRDFVELLKKHKPVLRWEDKSLEHYFIYADKNVKHAVFYPSLYSISVRLKEALDWGTGLSIWEIGQGLDYFFELL
ncbi:hypothetical protein LUZ60_008347 [Juncus effusus]|nr:hypothetical protein LUZ60_008347 [Juncus effusus]